MACFRESNQSIAWRERMVKDIPSEVLVELARLIQSQEQTRFGKARLTLIWRAGKIVRIMTSVEVSKQLQK